MMTGGPFEPYVEPVPGQFDAADGSFNVGQNGMGDFFDMDTGMRFCDENTLDSFLTRSSDRF